MKAQEFDEKFEAGQDVTNELDFSKDRRVNQESRRVNIDVPAWVVDGLETSASSWRHTASACNSLDR